MPVARCSRDIQCRPRAGTTFGVLQIALAPAPVAHRVVADGGRAFLVAAAEARRHVDAPAGAPHQRRLDEIVAEDVAAERLAPRQQRQAGLLGKGLHADDGVVAPVVAFGAVPPGDAARDQRPVDAAGELLDAGEQRIAVEQHRQGLDQADARMPLHGGGEPHDGVAFHQAVGVEHDHVRVVAAEAGDPLADIAGLARRCCGCGGGRRCGRSRCARAGARKAASSATQVAASVVVAEDVEVEMSQSARCSRPPRRSPAAAPSPGAGPRCRSAAAAPCGRTSSGSGCHRVDAERLVAADELGRKSRPSCSRTTARSRQTAARTDRAPSFPGWSARRPPAPCTSRRPRRPSWRRRRRTRPAAAAARCARPCRDRPARSAPGPQALLRHGQRRLRRQRVRGHVRKDAIST